jgi:AN1-like zinc finger protein
MEETAALKCELCGSDESFLLVCNYCGGVLCSDHRLRDDHRCGVRLVRRGAGSKEIGRTDLLRGLRRLDIERWEREGGLNAAFDNGVSKAFAWLAIVDNPEEQASVEKIDRLIRRFTVLGHERNEEATAPEAAGKLLAEDKSKGAYIATWKQFNRAWLDAKAKSLAEGDKMKFKLLTEKAASSASIERIEAMEEYAVGLRNAMADLDKLSEEAEGERYAGRNLLATRERV